MSAEQVLQLIGIVAPTIAFIVAISIAATIYSTRYKIKHGYPLSGAWGQSIYPKSTSEDGERIKLLNQENAQLRGELGSIKDRLANVERIATEANSLEHRHTKAIAAEIEALREKDPA